MSDHVVAIFRMDRYDVPCMHEPGPGETLIHEMFSVRSTEAVGLALFLKLETLKQSLNPKF